jgi:parallel beta-helix repeat protein
MYFLGCHTRARPSRRPRLEVEAVEGRSLLSTLFVNPKLPQDFHTIQSAVNAAKPGDTIEVAPGTYHETVFIDKTLTLLGAQAGVNPITGLRSNPANESTVDGGITIKSTPSVSVDGFSLNDPGGGPLADQSGAADLLTNNIILPGARVGVELFNAPLTTVSDNEVEGAVLDGISVVGITVVGSPPTHLVDSVRGNEVFNSSLEGINVFNAVSVTVDGNSVSGSGSFGLNVQQSSDVTAANNLLVTNVGGAVFFDSSGNNIQANTVEFNRFDGLDDEGDQGDIIQANSVFGNATSGVGNALFLSNASGHETVKNNSVLQNHSNAIEVFGTSTDVTVSGNTVKNNGGDGIGLNGTIHSIVAGNLVNSNAVGIHFAGASFSQVTGNIVDNNRLVGIQLDRLSVSNTVSLNTALDNGLFDAEDDSIGLGTAGTANTWTANTEHKDNHGGGLGH